MINCPNCHAQFEVKIVFSSAPAGETPVQQKLVTGGDDVGLLLRMINTDALNTWESNFVSDVRDKYEKYKDKIRMSDKQISTLRKIAEGSAF